MYGDARDPEKFRYILDYDGIFQITPAWDIIISGPTSV